MGKPSMSAGTSSCFAGHEHGYRERFGRLAARLPERAGGAGAAGYAMQFNTVPFRYFNHSRAELLSFRSDHYRFRSSGTSHPKRR
jgi:hypothetical protein